MSRLSRRSAVLLALAAAMSPACQLLVDPDARELNGDGGFVAVDATLPRLDGGGSRDAGADGALPIESDGATPSDSGIIVQSDGGTCATTKCPSSMYCDDTSGTAECSTLPSCDNVACEVGSMCELVDVLCFRAPCPPLPQCVTTPTCFPPCGFGRHCESILGLNACVLNTTTDAGTSRDAGTSHDAGHDAGTDASNSGSSCGKSTCSSGLECCNESCGTCVMPGRSCSQIACN